MNSTVALTLDLGPHSFTGEQGEYFPKSPIITAVGTTSLGVCRFADYEPVGDIVERDIELPQQLAEKFSKFFQKRYGEALPSYPPGNADCHSFIGFLFGSTHQAKHVPHWTVGAGAIDPSPTSLDRIEPYSPYLMVSSSGQSLHAVLAIEGDENLSVRGTGSPTVLAKTEEMLHEYNAQTLHKILAPPHYLT